MKRYLLRTILAAALLMWATPAFSAEPGNPQKQLQELIAKVNAKIQAGQKTEKELADEMKQLDALLAEHGKEKTDEVAQILVTKAVIYLQVFEDNEKGKELVRRLKADFPKTKQGQQADQILANIEKGEAAKKIQNALVVGSKFPDFNEKDINGKPMSVSSHKGKVALLDFWATWCGPCIAELPNVLATYQKHRANGFEIVGISLDRDEQKLKSFIKENNMTWPQFFDGKVWENRLAMKYGVMGIPATWLLDREGTIIGKNLRGEDLEKAVAAALAKK